MVFNASTIFSYVNEHLIAVLYSGTHDAMNISRYINKNEMHYHLQPMAADPQGMQCIKIFCIRNIPCISARAADA